MNHFDEKGNAIMVDVSEKNSSVRIAIATGMEKAIYQKPRQHKFIEKNVSENKLMSQIGG